MQILADLLDICQKRFTAVKRLFLRAPPSGTLAGFFVNRREWLKDLVELHVELEPTASDSAGTELCEVSFPYLRQLTWREYRPDPSAVERWLRVFGNEEIEEKCHAIALNAPELRCLTVDLDSSFNRKNLQSRLRDPDVCSVFLPTLELKAYAILDTVTISGLHSVEQRCVDNSEYCLRNLRVLTFLQCDCSSIERICGKCANLKDLTIEETLGPCEMSLQIAPILSTCLENLTINRNHNCFGFPELIGNAVFQKLQSICLRQIGLLYPATLEAPQLTECDTISSYTNGLTILYVEQIRTLNILLCRATMESAAPLPNVERLGLQLFSRDKSHKFFSNYLTYFPNIWHLTLYGYSFTLELSFVERLQRLEHFSVHNVTIKLSDIEKFARLKTLELTNCTLRVKRTDGEVSLAALEKVTMDHVEVKGPSIKDRFPIRVSEQQPPIVFVMVSKKMFNVFSSKIV